MNGCITTPDATYQLKTLTLDDKKIELVFDISNLSEKMQTQITNKIEESKRKFDEDWKKKGKQQLETWTDNIDIFCQTLNVYISDDKKVDAFILIMFNDANNGIRECDFTIPVDLSAYKGELKSIVMEEIEKRFFVI